MLNILQTIRPSLDNLILEIFRVDSIWSIVTRGLLWLIFVSILAIGVSKGKKYSRIKGEAGFFVAFIILTGLTIYVIYGLIPTLTTTPQSLFFYNRPILV